MVLKHVINFIYCLKKEIFKGLYLGPTGTLEQVNFYQEYAAKTSSDFLGLGAILGYQFLLYNEDKANGFVIDLNGGFTNFFGNSTITLNNKTIGFVPRISLGIGYSF
jgi:hypothetical protein